MTSVPAVYSRILRPVPEGALRRPAVFLDRDGVLTEDPGYLCKPDDVRLLPGAAAAVAAMNRLGFPVVLVSNQSGIGRGYYGWAEFEQVEDRIRRELARSDAGLDAEWACAYYPGGKRAFDPAAAAFRKPNPGMLEQAAAALSLSLADSWLVGDKLSDIEAAQSAGLHGALHVKTGCGEASRPAVLELIARNRSGCRIHLADSLGELIPILAPRS